MKNLDIIGHRNIFLTLSAILVGLAFIVMAMFGFKQGIDFEGGTLWQFKLASVSESEMQEFFENKLEITDATITFDAANLTFLVRLPTLDESRHQRNLGLLTGKYPETEELGFQSIGPSIGHALRKNALIALILVLFGVSLYIAFAFRKVSRPISSWKYGVVTLLTLFHDVLIPAGLLSFLGYYKGIEIDSNFVVALLVIMGFSVHDTIVVFDRIRENLALDRGKADFAIVVNQSINQTFARSVNTSLTLILVLLALIFMGPESLYYFILTLLVGVTIGIYSSIFVASPLLLAWQRMAARRK